MSTIQHWYLVFTKVKSELKAQQNLLRQGYTTYLPMTQKKVRRNGKFVYSTAPFFPRYMFIKLNTATDNWKPISSTIGVSHMVRFGGLPALVPDSLVAALQLHEDNSGLHQVVEKPLLLGDQVMVLDGPFAGYHGVFQYSKGAERVAILLDIVGRNTEVVLSQHDLAVA